MSRYYDRYSRFFEDEKFKPVVGVKIPRADTDKSVIYRQGQSRLDILSNTYYNTPYCGWLIMLANPQFGGLEFNIPDYSIITVPFPFETAVERYISSLNTHFELYGK